MPSIDEDFQEHQTQNDLEHNEASQKFNLNALRIKAGLSQNQLAKMTRISQAKMSTENAPKEKRTVNRTIFLDSNRRGANGNVIRFLLNRKFFKGATEHENAGIPEKSRHAEGSERREK